MLDVNTLGELRLGGGAEGVARPLRRKPLALLSYIARRAPRAVARTELATLLWGERGEERARQSLRQALTELKQALGDRIDVDTDSVGLKPGSVRLDITEFEREVASGNADAAWTLWQGDFMEGGEDIGGDNFRRWIESERASLHQLLGVAMEKLVGDAELRGDWAGAADRAERWASALPLNERAHLRLIEAYRMGGRNADALKAHTTFVARVRTELDVDPSHEFLRLGGGLADGARSDFARQGRRSAAVRPPALVGRTAVMRELTDAWERVESSAGVVLVRGEAGSGISRITDEIADHVRRKGGGAIVMQARGAASSVPLATASALFDGLRNASGSAGASPEALAEVARLVPALGGQFRDLPPPAGDEASLRDALVQVLSAIGEEQPVLLVVDDLHAADAESRRLLGGVASRLPRGVLLVLAEAEGESLTADDRVDSRRMSTVHLTELPVGDVETLLDSMVTLEAGERRALAARLHSESGGLPVSIVALVHTLVDEQLLRLDSGSEWRVSPALGGRPLPVPQLLRERARLRLERASPRGRALAEALAVLGVDADASVVGEVADLAPDDAHAAAAELLNRRVVRDVPAAPGHLKFPGPLYARAIAAIIPPTRREALHARAVQVLEERDLGATAERSLLSYHVARATRPTSGEMRTVAAQAVRWPRRTMVAGGVVALALVAAAVAWSMRPGRGARADAGVPIIALGRITDYRPEPGTDLTKPLSDMLATNLGRVPGLRVVSSARMYELVSQGNPGDTSAGALVAAARRAGATELVDGALYARDDGGLRLDLRRVELAGGRLQQTHSVAGRTLFELADSGTARLALDFGASTPAGSVSDVTTKSLAAYGLYEQGLRAYYANDNDTAEPLFRAALREDSTFAMAAYYAAVTTNEPRVQLSRFVQAARLSGHTSDRERLTILAHHAFLSSDSSLRAVADTLVVRYPDEVEGYYFKGLSLSVDGRFLESLAPFRRVVSMDSLALHGVRARCLACVALRQIVFNYRFADSLVAAEREVRHWMRLQPRSPLPYGILAEILSRGDRPTEAYAALEQSAALEEGRNERIRLLVLANFRMRAGDFEAADRLYAGEIEGGSPYRASEGHWYRAISYRNQGRLREALADALGQRALINRRYPMNVVRQRRALPEESYGMAQVLFEMKRYRESAAVFDSVGRWSTGGEAPSQQAHLYAWATTHATSALILGGDTSGVEARIDSVEAVGMRSGLKRDQLLHKYLRGMLFLARGRNAEAVSELRQAIFSWTFGYSRTNMALAEAYLRVDRPLDAIAALQPAVRGDIEGSNFYVALTDVHEMLAEAWSRVPTPAARDSATMHAAYVLRAWSRADSAFAPRIARMRALVPSTPATR